MNSLTLKISAAVITSVLCFTPAVRAAASASSGPDVPKSGVEAASGESNLSARAIVGQDARSKHDEDLGEVKNLVVDTHSGKVVFATLTQGGILGVGDTVHAVPYELLQVPQSGHGTITVDTDKATLDSGPTVPPDDPAWFAEHAAEIYRLYGKNWKAFANAVKSNTAEMRRLMTVDGISGKDVVQNGRQVGTIEDVIINRDNRQSAALLDPNDNFAGTNRKFLVAFRQLRRGPKDNFTTSLAKSDFTQAAPSSRNTWAASAGYPYAWDYMDGAGYSMNHPATIAVGARASVGDIRHALRRDPAIDQSVDRLSFDQDQDTLIVRGTVASNDVKDRIDDKLNAVARGWKIDDRVTVKNAAE